MTIEGRNGQFGFSDEELGIETPREEPAEALTPGSSEGEKAAIAEAEEIKPERISDSRTALLSAEVGTMPDPHPKEGEKPQEMSIHQYLLREIDQSWHKCSHKDEIARIIMDRFDNDPEAIRRLAEGYRTDYVEQLEQDIAAMREELEESYDKYDRVFNPQAIREQDHLRKSISEAEKALEHKKLVANDIAYGLEKIADLI